MIARLNVENPDDTDRYAIFQKVNELVDVVNVLIQAAKPKTINEAGEVVPAKEPTP